MTKYLVWRPEYGQEPEDGTVVDAYDANAAACKWAELYDAEGADYLIVRGSDATVKVRAVNKPADEWEMIVSGESVPSYRARVRIPLPPSVAPQLSGNPGGLSAAEKTPRDPLEIEELWDEAHELLEQGGEHGPEVHELFARLIERAHGIGA